MTCTRASAIIFFIKAPVPGRVKSRLATALGDDTALSLYRAFVLDMLETIERTGIPYSVFVDPPDAVPAVSSWLGQHRRILPQRGSDLGERMANAFRGIFAAGAEHATLIGSDIPDLPIEILHQAMDALERHDAVIGPAQDGGYYLIGFRRTGFLPSVFSNMTWSVPDVFARTMQFFRQVNTAVHVLPPWQDVDTAEDLRELLRRSRNTACASSRTARHLEMISDTLSKTEDTHGTV